MRLDARVLVIGPDRFRAAVGTALPQCNRVDAAHALAGVWRAGQEPFEGVLLCLAAGKNAVQAVRSLREVAPQARIVVSCPAADEPGARQALECGADDYVIEPVTRVDLERALQLPVPPRPNGPTPPAEPSLQEKVQFVDVLKNLGEGPQAALDRMAALVKRTFDAAYVALDIDDLVSVEGDFSDAVLQEPIRRQDQVVGAVTLGRRNSGSYGSSALARLADYARLTEAVVTVARERAHWQNLAWTDDVSTLRNRRYFERRFDQIIEQCGQRRAELTVLLLDIDDFKSYNDRFGHETGDAVIREVARLLTSCSRETDIVARYGGDEFVVLFWDADKPRIPGSRHPTEPLAFAERFLNAVRTHEFRCLGPHSPGEVTVSGGLASFPWDGRTREDLLRAADAALHAAKHTGKNRIRLACSADNETAAEPTDETAAAE